MKEESRLNVGDEVYLIELHWSNGFRKNISIADECLKFKIGNIQRINDEIDFYYPKLDIKQIDDTGYPKSRLFFTLKEARAECERRNKKQEDLENG